MFFFVSSTWTCVLLQEGRRTTSESRFGGGVGALGGATEQGGARLRYEGAEGVCEHRGQAVPP